MTTSHDLLKQALEALEDSVPINAEKHWKLVEDIRAHLAKEPEPYRWVFTTNRVHEWSSKELPPDDAYDEGSLIPLYRKEDV